MKNLYRVALIIILFLGFTAVSSYAGTEKYGEAISNRQLTAIKDILANPKAYEGKLVTIEGGIVNECSTGCWFFVGVTKGGPRHIRGYRPVRLCYSPEERKKNIG